MSGASCLACLVTNQSLRYPSGNINEPLGCCRNCHSLICGHHGHRDQNKPGFICVLCDPSLAVASAAAMVDEDTDILVQLRSLYFQHDLPKDEWVFRSLEDLEKRRPDYGPGFFDRVRNARVVAINPEIRYELRHTISTLAEKAPELLAAAYHIIQYFEFPPQHIPVILQEISDAVEWEER